MEVMTACIGMLPPFTHVMWTKRNKDLSINACEVAKNSCVAAAEHLHIVRGKPLDEVLDVVTVDGTWLKRGRTSLLVLLWLLLGKLGRQVLAWEVLSKHCMACKLREDMVRKSIKKEWYEGHKESVSVITGGHPMVWRLLV